VSRKTVIWPHTSTVFQATVSIWPSTSDYASAPCGDVKKLFVATDGAGVSGRVWFAKDALEITKVCGP
jgi:hypothetical protein